MKKLLSKILVVALLCCLCASFFTGCAPREEVLKIYNWGEYMEPSVYKDFEDWYKEKTGKTVKVKYQEFSTNEDMYTQINKKKADFDLVCPSDYMADKMIKEGLAKEIDKNIVDLENTIRPDLLEMTKAYDPESKYTVPYMWGTFGIMYDTTKVTTEEAEKMNSWSAMFDPQFKDKIFMKDSIRDAYAMANIYNHTAELRAASNNYQNYDNEEYRNLLNEIFSNTEASTIASVKKALEAQKPLVYKYEVDDGKDSLMKGDTKAVMGLFWSCDSGYVMNDIEEGGTGCSTAKTIKGNKNLFYVVPEEGANVWVDCWLIPKYAENATAAQWFLKYLCEVEVAKANMAYVGSSSPITKAMEEYRAELEEDEEFFNLAKEPAKFKEMYLDMMFPSEETLERCAIMKDFAEASAAINSMWIDVKAG